jgi:pimeloyl-ACP methyl ester carboxylesterase
VATGTTAANGMEIAYETFGKATDEPVLLIMGLGGQMIAWPEGFCTELVSRGCHVVRFDNRDVGHSTHLHSAPMPNLMAALMGDTSSAAYTLDDMADDGFALLEALGIPSAHVVGQSLGGMIAQTMAIRRPDRVRSLTSIMSTPDPKISSPRPEAQAALMQPMPRTREEAVARALGTFRIIASPAGEVDEEWVTAMAAEAWDRGRDPVGVMRQTMAIYASGSRSDELRRLGVPTLVIHGEDDPLIDVSAGRVTADLVPGAELLVLPGMGHDLPRALWPTIADAIAALVARSSGRT